MDLFFISGLTFTDNTSHRISGSEKGTEKLSLFGALSYAWTQNSDILNK